MRDLHCPDANVIPWSISQSLPQMKLFQSHSQSFVVDAERKVRVLNELVNRKESVIGLFAR